MTDISIRRGDWRPAIRPLPEAHAVAAVGDVHGHDDLFEALLAAIADELSGASAATFVQLGDLVDRGPASIAALRRARAGMAGATSITLLGNHEDRMLRCAESAADEDECRLWLDFGGRETLASAGVDPDAARWPEAFASALGRDLLHWLKARPLTHRVGDLLFVHAGIDPAVALQAQSPHTLMWTRQPFLESPGPYPEGVAVIHGHTPQPDVDLSHPHRINLDTGAFRTGILSGLVVRGERMRVVQAVRATA